MSDAISFPNIVESFYASLFKLVSCSTDFLLESVLTDLSNVIFRVGVVTRYLFI